MIRLGIIGAGPNAVRHAQYFAQSPRSRVVAIADPDQARAQSLASEVQAEALSDYQDFLAQVDAVVISSPNFLHREHAIACAQAGKHLYCEKPLGLSLADAQAIAIAVQETGVSSIVGFSVRFEPPLQTMQRLLREGALGSLVSLISRRIMYMNLASGSSWRADARLSGGYLLEIGLHELDWMLALGGDVQSVYACTQASDGQYERANDYLWVILNYAEGAVGTHEGGWMAGAPVFHRSLVGTRSTLQTDEWGSQLYSTQPGQEREQLQLDTAFDLRGHFLDCIEHGTDPVADISWGVRVMTVAEAILRSAHTGRVVSLSEIN